MGCSEGQAALAKAGKALKNAATAQARADQAYDVAMGLVYIADDYSSLVTALNAAAKKTYTLGATIYVKTQDVPDLWVSANEESSQVPYTYTTDDAMVADLKANPTGLAIGYYKINILETPKIPAVLFESQTLTDVQKGVARANISAQELITAANKLSSDLIECFNEGYEESTLTETLDGFHQRITTAQETANSKIGDATSDGKQYARKNGAWDEVVIPINADAPSDGKQYARKNGAWDEVAGGSTSPRKEYIDIYEGRGQHIVSSTLLTNLGVTGTDAYFYKIIIGKTYAIAVISQTGADTLYKYVSSEYYDDLEHATWYTVSFPSGVKSSNIGYSEQFDKFYIIAAKKVYYLNGNELPQYASWWTAKDIVSDDTSSVFSWNTVNIQDFGKYCIGTGTNTTYSSGDRWRVLYTLDGINWYQHYKNRGQLASDYNWHTDTKIYVDNKYYMFHYNTDYSTPNQILYIWSSSDALDGYTIKYQYSPFVYSSYPYRKPFIAFENGIYIWGWTCYSDGGKFYMTYYVTNDFVNIEVHSNVEIKATHFSYGNVIPIGTTLAFLSDDYSKIEVYDFVSQTLVANALPKNVSASGAKSYIKVFGKNILIYDYLVKFNNAVKKSNIDITDKIKSALNLPAPPSTDGTYVYKVTIVNGVPTYSWVLEE